jgi:hypothetical protein
MTEWSRETSWRQGNALTDETVDKFGLCDPQSPEKTVVVVTPHDCDLAASPDREPDVEMIIGRLIEKADGNFTHAKTPRILHIEFTTQDSAKVIELAATKKSKYRKVILLMKSQGKTCGPMRAACRFFSDGWPLDTAVRPFRMHLRSD